MLGRGKKKKLGGGKENPSKGGRKLEGSCGDCHRFWKASFARQKGKIKKLRTTNGKLVGRQRPKRRGSSQRDRGTERKKMDDSHNRGRPVRAKGQRKQGKTE